MCLGLHRMYLLKIIICFANHLQIRQLWNAINRTKTFLNFQKNIFAGLSYPNYLVVDLTHPNRSTLGLVRSKLPVCACIDEFSVSDRKPLAIHCIICVHPIFAGARS